MAFGINPATNKIVELGAAIGIIAALPGRLYPARLSLSAWGDVLTRPAILILLAATSLQVILSDPAVRCVFINIFGGIVRCDMIAEGIIAAVKEVDVKVPVVVRLEGTNVELGKEIIRNSGLNVIAGDNLADAAQKIVKAVKG